MESSEARWAWRMVVGEAREIVGSPGRCVMVVVVVSSALLAVGEAELAVWLGSCRRSVAGARSRGKGHGEFGGDIGCFEQIVVDGEG